MLNPSKEIDLPELTKKPKKKKKRFKKIHTIDIKR
jgi:hypothetical protein